MNWQNIFKADQTSFVNGTDTGFVGFFQPKYLNGTWGFQDPIACSPLTDFCSLTSNPSETFESSVWEYQLYVSSLFIQTCHFVLSFLLYPAVGTQPTCSNQQ